MPTDPPSELIWLSYTTEHICEARPDRARLIIKTSLIVTLLCFSDHLDVSVLDDVDHPFVLVNLQTDTQC